MSRAHYLDVPESKNSSRAGTVADPRSDSAVLKVAILTGGADKPYNLGLAAAWVAEGIPLDFIGSDDINGPELHNNKLVNFLNLRGDQSTTASRGKKLLRVLKYYVRLIRYAATAKPRIFHIIWNNKFEFFDRTLLMLYYRMLGKRIVFTAHNVNAGKRDGNDSVLNRLTLGIQYRLCDHIFVHTERMQRELQTDFPASASKVSIIPFGINNTLPNTSLKTAEAKQKFGLEPRHKTLLFFGNIAPYKGLEYLITALAELVKEDPDYRLIIGGRPKGCDEYWAMIGETIARHGLEQHIIQRIEYIPDEAVEQYFKASDVLVLPYTHIFQSGVLFLGYSFGLPVIASDVGSLKDDMIPGQTGWICRPVDARDLARALREYFASDVYRGLENRRRAIQDFAGERYSWEKVARITRSVYESLIRQ
jgi:D-inositol-3-phosphate glycosyltransferase